MTLSLDEIDRRILNALQDDGHLQNIELAKRVGLSPSPCLRRVRLMEEAGIIERYVAILDSMKVGAGMTVFARVCLTNQDEKTVNSFIAFVNDMPQITECHLMTGDCDFLLRVVVQDLGAYRQFQINYLTRLKIVKNIKTEIPMQKIKQTSKILL